MSESTSKTVKAIAYCRVATIDQTSGHSSLDTQKRQIAEYAKGQNLEIVKSFEQVGREAVTFPLSNLDKALDYCKANQDIKYLLVTKLDRVSRQLDRYYFWKTAFERVGVTIKPTDETHPISTTERIIEDAYLFMVAEHEHEVRLAEIEEAIRNEKIKGV